MLRLAPIRVTEMPKSTLAMPHASEKRLAFKSVPSGTSAYAAKRLGTPSRAISQGATSNPATIPDSHM